MADNIKGYPMNLSGRLSSDETPADANARRAREIKENKFFTTEKPFSFKYPSTVAENFKEEINFNTHDSSEYALVRSSIDANGNQLGIDDDAIEPYVIFEFMRLMTDDKKKALSKWQDKNNFTRRNSSALKKEIYDAKDATAPQSADDIEAGAEKNFVMHAENRALIEASGIEDSMFDKAKRVFGGSIAMYMPTDIQINDAIGYSEESRQIAAMLEDFGTSDKVNNATMFNPTTIAAGAGGVSWLADAASKSTNTRIAGSKITKWLSKGNVGLSSILGYGAGGVISDEMQRHHGQALNPNEYMAYQNTPMRSFSFNFTFLPDSAEESTEATDIIRQFRYAAHAEKRDNLTINVPDHVVVSFHGANDMIQLPAVVIDSVNVSYNPNNTSFFKHNNAPVEIGLAVTLKEIAPIFKGDVERGF